MTIKFSASTRGFYDDSIHSAIPADAVEISAARHRELLQGQSLGKVIGSQEDGQPVLVDSIEPLALRQLRAWAAIQAERDRRTQGGGFMVQGYWFHSDTFSRTQHLGMFVAGNHLPAGIRWKTMDGRFVEMTPELAQQLFLAASASDPLVFFAAEKHKAAMLECPDPLAYEFSAGWPACFTDLFPS